MKPGDKVVTRKGCRIAGPPGVMEVVKPAPDWNGHKRVTCRKPDGSLRPFLLRNLLIVDGAKGEGKG